MMSDLENASKTVELDNTRNGAYPLSALDANNGQGLKSSNSSTLVYQPKSYGYCLVINNPKSSKTLRFKSSVGKIEEGICDTVVNVSTLAGNGTAGYVDGTGTAAQFNFANNLAVDSAGTIYIADTSNQRIRKITPAGVVTTLAGSGIQGNADGTGTAAQFNNPIDVAVDSSGTVYVADYSGRRIRKITPAGVVTTLAGSGAQDYTDGTGTAAAFFSPNGITVDTSGTVYVADNNRIRKITSSGGVSTWVGGSSGYADGTGTAAQFWNTTDIAVDSAGNAYITDVNLSYRVRKVTPTGVVTTLAGSGSQGYTDGTGTAAQFGGNLYGIAVDSAGNVIVSDGKIRKITPAGVVTTLAGSGVDGSSDGAGTNASFYHPRGLTIDSSGRLYLADWRNQKIRLITID
jgi:sugar lactone lactonase YvrE